MFIQSMISMKLWQSQAQEHTAITNLPKQAESFNRSQPITVLACFAGGANVKIGRKKCWPDAYYNITRLTRTWELRSWKRLEVHLSSRHICNRKIRQSLIHWIRNTSDWKCSHLYTSISYKRYFLLPIHSKEVNRCYNFLIVI